MSDKSIIYTHHLFCSTVFVIMRESLPRVEKRKERKDVKRRGTGTGIEIGIGIGIEREIRIGGEAKTGIGKGIETETETGIEKGTEIGIVNVNVIVIIEIATGTAVIEGNGEEIGMMMMIITAAGTMTGIMSRILAFLR